MVWNVDLPGSIAWGQPRPNSQHTHSSKVTCVSWVWEEPKSVGGMGRQYDTVQGRWTVAGGPADRNKGNWGGMSFSNYSQ